MKKTLLTGIQTSGNLMIGNYIGAIRHCVKSQHTQCDSLSSLSCGGRACDNEKTSKESRDQDYDCFLMLADLHSMTVTQDPTELRKRCYDFIALYLACGIDPVKSTIFVQSHVPGHSQLACLLNNFVGMGELQRMTQYKDKARKNQDNINAGLFTYPVLMAADILLYGTDLVPVGADQKQHLELARNVAQRFNKRFGDFFTVPEAYIPEVGARIMSLQDPLRKMSKSDPDANSYIALLDSPDTVTAKLKKAVTDSGNAIVFNPGEKPGISNLLTLYSCLTGESIEAIETKYAGQGYGHLKLDLADHIIEFLKPIQENYRSIINDERYLGQALRNGAESAKHVSEKLIRRMNERLGFIPFET